MSVENPRISVVWLAYYCGDNQMVEELIPDDQAVADRRAALATKTQGEGIELFDFEDSELLLELADNYWNLKADQRSVRNTVVTSENALVRCVIWPLSNFRFEGRAYLTDLSVAVEGQVAAHLLRTKLKGVTATETRLAAVPIYKGNWKVRI